MSDSERREFFETAVRVVTPKDREIARLQGELREASARASKAESEAAALRHVFKLGWREDEDQWRLTKAHVLTLDVAHLVSK